MEPNNNEFESNDQIAIGLWQFSCHINPLYGRILLQLKNKAFFNLILRKIEKPCTLASTRLGVLADSKFSNIRRAGDVNIYIYINMVNLII
jgi:hypothetical protein